MNNVHVQHFKLHHTSYILQLIRLKIVTITQCFKFNSVELCFLFSIEPINKTSCLMENQILFTFHNNYITNEFI